MIAANLMVVDGQVVTAGTGGAIDGTRRAWWTVSVPDVSCSLMSGAESTGARRGRAW